jgi:hypothetical protein
MRKAMLFILLLAIAVFLAVVGVDGFADGHGIVAGFADGHWCPII